MSGSVHISDSKGVPFTSINPLPVTIAGDAIPIQITLPSQKSIKTVTGSISSNTQIVGAVAGRKIKVRYISWRTAYSAGTISPILTDGNGGTTLWQDLLQAISGSISGANQGVSAPDALCSTTSGNPLYLNPNGQTVVYSISYFDDDAS